jgi:hypothetical protein
MSIALTIAAFVALSAASARADAPGDLIKFWEQYRLPRTLHCKTTTVIDFKSIPPGIVHVAGGDEYWMDGAKYRISVKADASVFNGMSHDVRWDGERFQDFNPAGSLLIVSKKFKQKTPYLSMPLPLVPFMFLNPTGPDDGVKITFDELRGEPTRARLARARPVGPGDSELSFPGGTYLNLDCTYLIELNAAPPHGPAKITLRTSTGVDVAVMELTYKPVTCAAGVVYLADQVTTTSRTTDNRLMLSATATATVLEADTPIPAETFTIDYQTARRVIDVDIPPAQRHAAATQPARSQTVTPQDAAPSASDAAAPVISPGILPGSDEGQWTPARLLLSLAGIGAAAAALFLLLYRRFTAERGP